MASDDEPRSLVTLVNGAWRRFTVDAAIIVALAGLTASASYERSARIPPVLYQYNHGPLNTTDVWFDADVPNRFQLSDSRTAEQYQGTREHPFLPLVYYLPVSALRASSGVAQDTALRILTAAAGATWVGLLYVLLRFMGCRTIDALVFTILGMVSASAVFWFAVPEVFLFGSVTILAMLCVAAIGSSRESGVWLFTVAGSLTLGITVTNWMFGLLAAFLRYPWKRAVRMAANTLVVVSLLWSVERVFFPSAMFFLEGDRFELARFLAVPRPGRVVEVMAAFVSHSMIMPEVQWDTRSPFEPALTIQSSFPGSGGLWGCVGACAWVGLLAIGVFELVRGSKDFRFRALLGLSAVGQLALHVVFGSETFLYSMHFVPVLLGIAGLGALGRWRRSALTLAGALIVSAYINNMSQFERAVAFVETLGK